MTEKRFVSYGDVVSDTDMKIPITLWSDKKQQKKFCDELNALHEENQRVEQAFEKTMEDAFDRYMDSRIAEEVIDYIHISFYDFLKRGYWND